MSFNVDASGEALGDDEEFPPPIPAEKFIQLEIRNNEKAPLEENIQTVELRITVQKPPFNGSDFVVLLDFRYIMKGDELAQMKEAMLHLLQQLTPLDRLSLVRFSPEPEVLCPLRLVTDSSRTELEDIVKGLESKKSKEEYYYQGQVPGTAMGRAIYIAKNCKPYRPRGVRGMILMSKMHYSEHDIIARWESVLLSSFEGIYTYWMGDRQNAKDWSHATAECLNKFRINDKIMDQTLTITEIKDESTIHKVSYDGGQQALGNGGYTTIEIDDDRYNHRILVELLLSATNKKRVADVLVGTYRYRYGYDCFQKSFKINVCRTGEVEVGQLEAPPELRVEESWIVERDSDDNQILRIDGHQFWRINYDQVVFFPPSSTMPCFPKPGPKPIIPAGRVQAVVRYNEKVTRGGNRQKVLLEVTGEEKVRRSPADIVAVLDVSSSMAGEKLAEMKRAMLFLITKLTLVDRLSIITYSSEAKMLYPLRPVTLRDKTKVENLINGMQAHDDAIGYMECGLEMGLHVLENRKCVRGRHGAIMFLAGGQSKRIGHYYYYYMEFVPVHTFGFGDDQDEQELYDFARRSRGGTYSDVRLGNLCVAFAQCLAGLLSVVAHCLSLFTSRTKDDLSSIHNKRKDKHRYNRLELGDLYAKERRKVSLVGIPLDEGKSNTDILHFYYSYEFDRQEYKSDWSIVTVSWRGEVSAEDVVREEMVLYAFDFVKSKYLREFDGDNSGEEMEERFREYLARELMQGPPEVLAQKWLDEISSIVSDVVHCYDLESAHAKIGYCMKMVRYCGKVLLLQKDVELWDDLWAELEELHALLSSHCTFEKEGLAFFLSLYSSLERQRHTSRGHNIGRFKLFATPLMRQFLHEAVDFEATYGTINN